MNQKPIPQLTLDAVKRAVNADLPGQGPAKTSEWKKYFAALSGRRRKYGR